MRRILFYLFAITLIIGFLLHPTLVLIGEDADADKILFRKKAEPGYIFATLIRHSVQRTPVYEYYQVEGDGTLTVTGTVLQDLGYGMPSNLKHEVKFEENGFMIMEGIDRHLTVLPFRISHIAEPHLILDKQKIDLRKYCGDTHLINIYSSKVPFLIFKIRGEKDVFQKKE